MFNILIFYTEKLKKKITNKTQNTPKKLKMFQQLV